MRIIDLLNKIAKGEEVPKEIIGKNSLGKKEKYIYNNCWYIHTFENLDGEEDYYYMNRDINNLNDEVEIIEEKDIEELEYCKITDETISGLRRSINTLNYDYVNKINEIVRKLKENK